MPDFFVPPKTSSFGSNPKPVSKTVTTAAASLLTSPDVPCIGVWLQSSSVDDSNAAQSAKMYILMESTLGSGTFDVLCQELVQGQETYIPCDNAKRIKVKTQAGTAWVRGFVLTVQPN